MADVWSVQMGGGDGGTLVNFHYDHFWGGTLVHFHDNFYYHFWGRGGEGRGGEGRGVEGRGGEGEGRGGGGEGEGRGSGYPGQLPWWPLLRGGTLVHFHDHFHDYFHYHFWGGRGYPGQLPWWPLLGGGTLVHFHDHFHDHFHYHFRGYPGQLPWWPLLGGKEGVPCDLSHNAVHVISALQTPKWWVWLGAHAYILLPQRIVGRSHGTPHFHDHFHDNFHYHFWGEGVPMWPIPQCSSCYFCSPDTKMMGLAWCTCLYSVAPKDCGKVIWDPPELDRLTDKH